MRCCNLSPWARLASRARRGVALSTTVALLAMTLLIGCDDPSRSAARSVASAPSTPAQAVRRLTRHLHDHDLAAFARDAVPPALHAQLAVAWRAGRTRWPLDELPLAARLPAALSALAAPGSEKILQATFDAQFADAGEELKSTAATLGAFGTRYVSNEGNFSADERAHYAQIVAAMSAWARGAPLSDRTRAQRAIARLAAAARRSGLRGNSDFSRRGMDDSLRRLTPFVAALEAAFADYGLRIDDSLAAADITLQSQTGDSAQVRLRYQLGDTPVDTIVGVERIDGRWYVSDHLRHARAAAMGLTPSTAAAATAVADPGR